MKGKKKKICILIGKKVEKERKLRGNLTILPSRTSQKMQPLLLEDYLY